MPARKSSFKNRFSFYLLAIGSACGLGNLWRFPYIVGENGGGAFLLLYVFLSLTVGLTLLISELMLGRYTGLSILAISRKASQEKQRSYVFFGWFSLFITAITLSYYSVISGWVLHYLTQFVMSLFHQDSVHYLTQTSINVLLESGWLQFLLASVHLLITTIIVLKGVGEGLEKKISSLLPLFGILVIILLIGSLSLDSTKSVLRFLFYPDFSKLNLSSLGHALGHVFFTLSLGFGSMVTFGGYLDKDEHLPTIGLRVTIVDTLISIIAVLLVFPIAFSSSKQLATDPSLLFDVMPAFLSSIKGGVLFGLVFFLFLWLAALNASIGLFETITANITEKNPKMTRTMAAVFSGSLILLATVFPAFSGSMFKDIHIMGRTIIEFFDSTLINVFLPIAVLGIVIIFFQIISKQSRKKIFVNENSPTSIAMFSHWEVMLKWIVPSIIVLALILLLLGVILR
ncbi:MAG: sodium-dependent transporter [Pseudobdellovibrio sp.]